MGVGGCGMIFENGRESWRLSTTFHEIDLASTIDLKFYFYYKLNLSVQIWEYEYVFAAAAAKSRQSCPTLCDPIDSGPPGSRPWDSPGKHTGVGCHFLLQCMKVKSESEVAQSCPTLRDSMDCSLPGSSIHGSFQARVLEWVTSAFSKNLLTFVHFQSLKNFHVCYHQLFEED